MRNGQSMNKHLISAICLVTITACSTVPTVDNCAFYSTDPPSWALNKVYEHGYGLTEVESEDSAKTALAKRIVTDVAYRLDAKDGEVVRQNMSITSDVRFSNIMVRTEKNPLADGCWVTWVAVSPKEADLLLARRWARDAFESLDWLKVKRSENTEDVIEFIQKYPGGVHLREAEEKLAEMKRKENREVVKVSIWFAILAAMSLL